MNSMKNYRIAIAVSKFNSNITQQVLLSCEQALIKNGIPKKKIKVFWVPGAYELPFIANELASSKKFDAVICLGCVIRGETSHDKHIAAWCAIGIGEVSLRTRVPCLFGVLTPNDEKQAMERAKPGPLN